VNIRDTPSLNSGPGRSADATTARALLPLRATQNIQQIQ
jgi:hypothetical protein